METSEAPNSSLPLEEIKNHANLVLDMLLAQLQQRMMSARALIVKNARDLKGLQQQEAMIRSSLEQVMTGESESRELKGLDSQDMIFFNKMCFSRIRPSERQFISNPQAGTGESDNSTKKRILPFQSTGLMSEVLSQFATSPAPHQSATHIPDLVNIPRSLVATAVSSLSSGTNSLMCLLKKFDHLYNNKEARINQLLQEQHRVNVFLESSRRTHRETELCLATDWEEKTRPKEPASLHKSPTNSAWMYASMGRHEIKDYEAYRSPYKSELQSEYASGADVQKINLNLKTSAFNSAEGTPGQEYGSTNSRYHESNKRSPKQDPETNQFQSGDLSPSVKESNLAGRPKPVVPKLPTMQASSGGQAGQTYSSTKGGESLLKVGHLNSQTRKLVTSYLTEVIQVGEDILEQTAEGSRTRSRSRVRLAPEKEAHLTNTIRAEVSAKILSLKADLASVTNIGVRKDGITNEVLFEKLSELAKKKVPRAVQAALDQAEKQRIKEEEERKKQKKVTNEDVQNFWTRNYSPYKSRKSELDQKNQKEEEEYKQILMYRSEYLNRVKDIDFQSHVLQTTETFEMRRNISKKSMTDIKNKDEKRKEMRKTSRSRSPWTLENHRQSMQKKFEKTGSKINTGLNTPDGERSRSIKNLKEAKDIQIKPLLRRKEGPGTAKKGEQTKIQPRYARKDPDKSDLKPKPKLETPVKTMGFAQPTKASESKLADVKKLVLDSRLTQTAKASTAVPRSVSRSVSRLSQPRKQAEKPSPAPVPVARERSVSAPRPAPPKPQPAKKPDAKKDVVPKPVPAPSPAVKPKPSQVAPVKFSVVESEIVIDEPTPTVTPVQEIVVSEAVATVEAIQSDTAKLIGPLVIALTDECSPDYKRQKPFVPSFMVQRQCEDKEKELERLMFSADCTFHGVNMPRLTLAGNIISLESPRSIQNMRKLVPIEHAEHPEVFEEAEVAQAEQNRLAAVKAAQESLEQFKAGIVVEVLQQKPAVVAPPPLVESSDDELQLEDDSLELD